MAWYLNRDTGVKFDLPEAIIELIENDRHQQYNFEPCDPLVGVTEAEPSQEPENVAVEDGLSQRFEGETESDPASSVDTDSEVESDPVSDSSTNKGRRGRKTS
jgi:hypothetical protein